MKPQNFKIVYSDKGKSLSFAETGLRKPRILVAPLDWGLGHASRCIPVIYELIAHNCDPWLAAEGAQEILLRGEFPQLNFLMLPGYRVKYGRSATSTTLGLLAQSSKILKAIRHEHEWLKKMQAQFQFDAIISDNRFGLFHPDIPCAFMTHQLHIKTGLGKITETLLRKRNYSYINRFSECWIPDLKGSENLAGELSHPQQQPVIPIRYMGLLSRFQKMNDPEDKQHLLVIISGPDPQRSIFEDMVIKGIGAHRGTATIVRGLPGSTSTLPSQDNVNFHNHLSAGELNKEMSKAGYVISRSGYSTIMDLIKLGKKSVLIPTPGQAEQEFLAKDLTQKGYVASISQNRFSISSALDLAATFQYVMPKMQDNNLHKLVSEFVHSLDKK